ncbi:MAG TPA: translocation/assembly module TamB domain-containing protein [Usitatibacter sp.]|nr:translocation/assembly module TamB domain-containing protein [Usitatibacter sp.]
MRRTLRWVLVAAIVLIVVAIGLGYWIVATPGGAQLVLGRAAGMLGKGAKIEGVEGRLGGRLHVKLIVVDRPDFYARIEDVDIDSAPFRALSGQLLIYKLYARSVELRTAGAAGAARAPVTFKPPYGVRLEDGRIGTFRHGAISRQGEDLVLRDITVKGEGDKSHWRIDRAAVTTPFGAASVSGTLGNERPFAIDLDGRLEGKVRDLAINVEGKAKGTLDNIEARIEGVVAGARGAAAAVLQPFAPSPLKSIDVQARDVDLARFVEGLPATRLAIDARIVPQGKVYAGPVRVANADPGPWDAGKLPFQSAVAQVVASVDQLDASGLRIILAGGGAAAGHAKVRKGNVEATLDVNDVDLAALHRGLQKTRVTGRVAVVAEQAAQRFEVSLRDPRFAVDGRARLAGERLDVETARVTTGSGAATGKGTLALKGAKEFRFEGRAEHFDPSAFVKSVTGDLNFAFVTSGTLANGIAGDAKLDIAPSTLSGQPAAGRVHLSGNRERIAAADVDVTVGEARVNAKGSFGRAGDALDVTFRAPNLSSVAKPFGIALAGRAEGTARVTGTFASPAGTVSLTGANLTLPSNVFVSELQLRAQAGIDPESAIDATVQARGVAMGRETPPTALAESARLTLRGTRRQHRLEADVVMDRRTSLNAALQGGIDPAAKTLAWSGRIESAAMRGQGAFALASPATLSLSAARIEVGDALVRGDWGEAHLAVTRWTPRTLDLKGTTSGLRVQGVARTFRLARIPASDLVVAGDWDIHAAESFNGSLNLRRVSGDLRMGEPALPLGLKELVLRLDAAQGRTRASLNVTSERVGHVEGQGSGLIARGETGWEFARASPIDARIVAQLPDLAPLQPWLGPDARLGGRVEANLTVSGTGADPRIAGRVDAREIVVREPQSGFEIGHGEVALRMDGRSLAVERFVARTPWRPPDRARESMRGIDMPADGGTISAEGVIDIVARKGSLRFKADKAVLTQLPSRFLAVSGDGSLQTDEHGLVAVAALKADAGWVGALAEALPTVSEDVVVIRASAPRSAASDDIDAREPMRIDAQVALDNHVWFQGRGLDARLDGNLRVTGQVGATLRATGTIRAASGTYEGYGQKLTIERGILAFNGPLDNPQLNVLALRKGLPVEAGVEILGTTTHPRVRLVSTPDVPEPEKLSWLVLGRGAADASVGDIGVMMAAARAMLGNNNSGSNFAQRFGVDEVKIGRADTNSVLGVLPQSTVAGRTGTPAAGEVVSVGKSLNRNLQLTYEQGLADAEGALKVTYRISRQFQLLARVGFLPGLDAVYRWTFK